jgi:hypothetical protein
MLVVFDILWLFCAIVLGIGLHHKNITSLKKMNRDNVILLLKI